jgi:hypothetical protein
MGTFREGLEDQLWNTDLSHHFPGDYFYREGHREGWADYIILNLKIKHDRISHIQPNKTK